MPATTWNTFSNDRQFDGGVRKRYFQRANQLASAGLAYELMGHKIDVSKRQGLYDTYDAATGILEETAEGAGESKVFVPRKVAERQIIIKTKKLGLVVSKELQEDDLYGYVSKHTPRLSDFTIRTLEQDFVDTFINTGFVYDAYRDQRDNWGNSGTGIPLYNDLHRAGLSGKTYANTGTISMLAEGSLGQALYAWTSMVDDGGLVTPQMPTNFDLWVHSSKLITARQIVHSTATQAVNVNSGVKSLTDGFTLNVRYTPYQTAANQWTLMPTNFDEENEGGFDVVMRHAPKIDTKENKDPDWKKWIASVSYSMLVGSARRAYSNKGS